MLTPKQVEEARKKLGINTINPATPTGNDLISRLEKNTKPNYFERVKDSFQSSISAAKEDITGQDDRSSLSKGISAVSNVASAIQSPVLEAPGIKQFGELLVKGMNLSGEQLSRLYSPEFQESLSKLPEEEFNKATQILTDLSNAGNIADTALAVKGIQQSGLKVGQVAKEGISDITKKTTAPLTNKIREGLDTFNPKDKPAAIKNIKEAYTSSFVDDSTSINKQLANVAKKYKTNVDGKSIRKTPDQLLDDLVNEGIAPRVEGKLAKFDEALAENTNKIKEARKIIKDSVAKYDETTNLDVLKEQIEMDLRKRGNALELKRSLKDLDNKIESIRKKYGNELDPKTLDQLRVDANAKTKELNVPLSEADTAGSIGNVVKSRLDEIIPDDAYKNANAEITKLMQLEDTMNVFNNKAIKVSPFIEQIGRFGGTVGGTAALGSLIGGSITGAGALVVAGVMAQLGSNIISKYIRNNKFSPKALSIIKETYKAQPEALEALIREASKQDAKTLEKFKESLISDEVK